MSFPYFIKGALFENPYNGEEPNDLARFYFDRIYVSGLFINALEKIAERQCLSVDGIYCDFGDINSDDEYYRYAGVKIEIDFYDPPKIDIIDEGVFIKWARIACERYIKIHPENKLEVENIISKLSSIACSNI